MNTNDFIFPVFRITLQIDAFLTAFANRFLPLGVLTLFFLTACGTDEPPPPNVDHLKKELTVLRFEQDLFAIDTNDIANEIAALEAKYTDFTDVYFRYAIPLKRGDFGPNEQVDVLKAFLRYPLIREVYAATQAKFSELQSSKADLEKAMAYYAYYFPAADVPDTLVTFMSQFEYAGFLYGNNQLAVGLDMYLGPNYDYKAVSPAEPIFSDYLTRTYTPAYLPVKMSQLLIEEQLSEPEQGRLIDYMIYHGKELYLLDLLLPQSPDSLKLEITAAQSAWLQENETEVYIYLQSQELLFETDVRKYRKYIDPSPNSPGMPDGAPGRSANYIGWKIVEQWMKNNPQATIKDLLDIQDGQRILAESRYKPRR